MRSREIKLEVGRGTIKTSGTTHHRVDGMNGWGSDRPDAQYRVGLALLDPPYSNRLENHLPAT